MKRILSLIIIIILAVLFFHNGNNSLLSKVVACGYLDYEYVCESGNEVVVLKNCDYFDIINNLSIEIHDIKETSDRLIIEGYSNCISNCLVIKGMKTNIQMSVFDNQVIIGTPLILGSF